MPSSDMTRFFVKEITGNQLIDVDNLLAFVHAGLAADMVRTDDLARVLVFDGRRCGQRMVRTAHVSA